MQKIDFFEPLHQDPFLKIKIKYLTISRYLHFILGHPQYVTQIEKQQMI